jgi:hypothetical protein
MIIFASYTIRFLGKLQGLYLIYKLSNLLYLFYFSTYAA